MTVKRVIACVLALVCVCALALPASAEDSMHTYSKIYDLRMTEAGGSITPTPETPAFWEYPVLSAGEVFLVEGTMVVKNAGDTVASMMMEPVALPYGDEAKLTYLDNLMLTVKEGDTVLFDNTYAHINDAEGGLSLIYNDMQPGEEHAYTIRIKCLYTYPGDVIQDAVPMSWTFSAKKETVVIEEEEKGMPPWLIITVITFAVIIVGLIVIMVVRAIMGAVAKKKRRVKKVVAPKEAAVTEDVEEPSQAEEPDIQEVLESVADEVDTAQEINEKTIDNEPQV